MGCSAGTSVTCRGQRGCCVTVGASALSVGRDETAKLFNRQRQKTLFFMFISVIIDITWINFLSVDWHNNFQFLTQDDFLFVCLNWTQRIMSFPLTSSFLPPFLHHPLLPPSQFGGHSHTRSLLVCFFQPWYQDAVCLSWSVHLCPVSTLLDVSSAQVWHLQSTNTNIRLISNNW